MEQYKRFMSLWSLCSKYTAKPIAAILTLTFFVQGGFMIYFYRVTDFTFQKEIGFDEISNSVIYQEQPWFYRFEELLRRCQIDLIFLVGAILILAVFFIKNTRYESIAASNITYKGLPVSQHSILNIQLLHTFTMIIIFVCSHYFILLFWHRVYRSILPEQVLAAQSQVFDIKSWGLLYQVFPMQNHIALVMNLIGILFLSVSLLYLPYIKKLGDNGVVYILLGVGSYLFLGRSEFVVGALVEICIFILCTLEMYLELHKRIRHERRFVMG
jgi:hypothetical protein